MGFLDNLFNTATDALDAVYERNEKMYDNIGHNKKYSESQRKEALRRRDAFRDSRDALQNNRSHSGNEYTDDDYDDSSYYYENTRENEVTTEINGIIPLSEYKSRGIATLTYASYFKKVYTTKQMNDSLKRILFEKYKYNYCDDRDEKIRGMLSELPAYVYGNTTRKMVAEFAQYIRYSIKGKNYDYECEQHDRQAVDIIFRLAKQGVVSREIGRMALDAMGSQIPYAKGKSSQI